jgi:hypothetical protein
MKKLSELVKNEKLNVEELMKIKGAAEGINDVPVCDSVKCILVASVPVCTTVQCPSAQCSSSVCSSLMVVSK